MMWKTLAGSSKLYSNRIARGTVTELNIYKDTKKQESNITIPIKGDLQLGPKR